MTRDRKILGIRETIHISIFAQIKDLKARTSIHPLTSSTGAGPTNFYDRNFIDAAYANKTTQVSSRPAKLMQNVNRPSYNGASFALAKVTETPRHVLTGSRGRANGMSREKTNRPKLQMRGALTFCELRRRNLCTSTRRDLHGPP